MYAIDDGTQYEMGVGVLTTGSPDTMSRSTVTSNSAGTTARLNFAGTCRIYCTLPAEKSVYKDASGILNTGLIAATEPATGTQTLLLSAASSANGICIKMTGNGATTPSKTLRVVGGNFTIVNNAYTTAILVLTDAGGLSVSNGVAAGGPISGTTLSLAGAVTGATSIALGGAITGATTISASGNISAASAVISGAVSLGTFSATTGGSGIGFTNNTGLFLNQTGAVGGNGIVINIPIVTSNFLAFTTASVVIGSIAPNGTGTATVYNTTSDYRLKTLFGKASGSLLSQLPVHDAAWTAAPLDRQPMVLAHEVAEVCPWAVTGKKDAVNREGKPIMQQVDYAALVPSLLAYVQSLETRLAALEGNAP